MEKFHPQENENQREDRETRASFAKNGWDIDELFSGKSLSFTNELWIQVIPHGFARCGYYNFYKKIDSIDDVAVEIAKVKEYVSEFQVLSEQTPEGESKKMSAAELPQSEYLSLYTPDREPRPKVVIDGKKLDEVVAELVEKYPVQKRASQSKAIAQALKEFPEETLRHYTGHGDVRGLGFENSIRILESNALIGYVGSLGQGIQGTPTTAYLDGRILIVSKRDCSLAEKKDGESVFVEIVEESKKPAVAIKMNAGAFVISGVYDAYVEPLKARYPHLNILHANELADYIKEQEVLSLRKND